MAKSVEPNVAEKALGLSWRSTLTGIGTALFSLLTVLAALPYELGDVALIIPAEWKAKVAVTGAIAALILRVLNALVTKDRQVTGGTIKCDAAIEKVVGA